MIAAPSRRAGAPAGLPVDRFSTALLPPAHRHAAWAAQGWPSVARAVESVPDGAFDAEAETIAVGPLRLIFGHYGAQTVRRTPALCRATPLGAINVVLPLTARIDADWGSVGPGELGLCDLDAVTAHHSARGSMVLFAVPRLLAAEHGLGLRALHGTTLPASSATLLRSHLLQIREAAATIAPEDGPRLARSVMDLLAIALASGDRIATPSVDAVAGGLKRQAETAIAAAVADPALGVDTLCRQLGVSRATLYRLFAAEGGVKRRIRQVRLLAARRALSAADARIADIAERFGFGDAATLSRAFRDAFGVSPSDWRAGGG